MVWYFLVGVLAAFGLLCALWALFGWLLPQGRGCAIVCFGPPDEGILTRSKWLRGAGLLNIPLIAVMKETYQAGTETEICSPEALISRLERERNEVHGTGNGNYPGCDQRCGISEL